MDKVFGGDFCLAGDIFCIALARPYMFPTQSGYKFPRIHCKEKKVLSLTTCELDTSLHEKQAIAD